MKVFVAVLLLFAAAAQAEKEDLFIARADVDSNHKAPAPAPVPVKGGEGEGEGEGRIVSGGGSNAAQGQFPWHAALALDGSGFCAASLLSATHLLTAAHCAQGVSTFTVRLGATNLQVAQSGVIALTTKTKIVHPSYNSLTLNNDIALLRLSSTVSTTTYVRPIRLPRASLGVPIGASVVACGYRTSSSTIVSPALRYFTLTTISNADCALYYGSLTSSSFCAISPSGGNPYLGDSGAAVALKEDDGQYTQLGLVTYMSSRCQATLPSLFTRVGSYLSWISANAGIPIEP